MAFSMLRYVPFIFFPPSLLRVHLIFTIMREGDTFNNPILKIRKLKPGEIEWLLQSLQVVKPELHPAVWPLQSPSWETKQQEARGAANSTPLFMAPPACGMFRATPRCFTIHVAMDDIDCYTIFVFYVCSFLFCKIHCELLKDRGPAPLQHAHMPSK